MVKQISKVHNINFIAELNKQLSIVECEHIIIVLQL
jgi:hypothetical protein